MQKFVFSMTAGLGLIGLAVTGCRSPEIKHPQSFTFVQMCDPQLGFGGYEADEKRFAEAIQQINELHPDFVVICGDLVNRADKLSFADFNRLKAELKVPCYCAPGNHDVGNKPTPKLLEQYRSCIGKDYYSFEHKGFCFVIADTSLWKSPLAGETARQDEWFRSTLAHATTKREPIIVVTHYPLFVKSLDETNGYYNLPEEKRKQLFALYEGCGVVAMLSGHTHTTLSNMVDGIQMATSQTTSKNFDKQPFGFRVWHVGGSRPYENEFVPLAEQYSAAEAK